ncbi:MAG: pantoate--beta-alanine ligase [bacterium]|nr:pantoate--beta-alanine ligase [bacterium]
MRTAHTITDLRKALQPLRRDGRRVGLVPTMGALHDGHWSLVEQARRSCETVVASIFVNPLQFSPGEDYEAYPRVLDDDVAGCAQRGCDVVFAPAPGEMYPSPPLARVAVRGLSERLCGRTRTGHFDGVATVVAKLFNVVQPDAAYFGEKDYQQLVVIRRMVRDLNMPIDVVSCPTVRDPDGMALSSRNAYLDADQRSHARLISAALYEAVESVRSGERDGRRVLAEAGRRLAADPVLQVEYVEIVHPKTLEPVARIDHPARLCVAARVDAVRLIDNMLLDPTERAE